jgi:hypothetical protein
MHTDNSQVVESYKKQPNFMLNLCQAAKGPGLQRLPEN